MFNFNVETQTQVISRILDQSSNAGEQQAMFIQAIINEFENSEQLKTMQVGRRYYDNKNDIMEKKRYVIGRDMQNNPVRMESKLLANTKLSHNYMKKLTRQKVAYMLAKPFIIVPKNADDDKAKSMIKDIQPYFTPAQYKRLKNIGRDSIIKGIAWLHPYYDETGELKFMRCNSEEIIPLWADSDHFELDAVIRKYTIQVYENGIKRDMRYVDYYTHEGIYHYAYDKFGKLVVDESKPKVSPHFSIKTIVEGVEVTNGVQWSVIPFIPFRYDSDEQSLITRIKTLIDDYDLKTSNISDDIEDTPNSITVVKNFDGSSREEFVHNKNQYRTIFVQGDGDAKSISTPINVTDVDLHLQRLREDIYEFGQGVNTADKDIRDTSGVALRFLYADLDMDCSDWGSEFADGLTKMIWFIQQDIMAKTGKNYTDVEYDIVFNTDVIVNETETIQNCFTSMNIVSNKTIAENHPWVLNAEKEITHLREEQSEVLELESEYGNKPNSEFEGQRSANGATN